MDLLEQLREHPEVLDPRKAMEDLSSLSQLSASSQRLHSL